MSLARTMWEATRRARGISVAEPHLPAQTPTTLRGLGDELSHLLKRLGHVLDDSVGCQSCRRRMKILNHTGTHWARQNIPLITAWLEESLRREVASSHVSPVYERIARIGIPTLIRYAIHRTERLRAIPRIFLIGYPGQMGGANTECFHLLALWKKMGLEVNLVPTWTCDPHTRAQLDALGYITHIARADALHEVPHLAGSPTVGMCNVYYCAAVPQLRALNCKIVWINCMTFMFLHERMAWANAGPPDACVYQSRYQQTVLDKEMRSYGFPPALSCHIPGAFDPTLYPYRYLPRTHPTTDPFVVGKLARPDEDKWPRNLWEILSKIAPPIIHAEVMGLNADTWNKVRGLPNDLLPGRKWVTAHKPTALPVPEYLSRLHCMITPNGGARENWPRVGLECFAAGVPVVAPNAWGWREMIRHGETGLLADTDEDISRLATELAYDEPLRERLATQARRALVETLANPEDQAARWFDLFFSLYATSEDRLLPHDLP